MYKTNLFLFVCIFAMPIQSFAKCERDLKSAVELRTDGQSVFMQVVFDSSKFDPNQEKPKVFYDFSYELDPRVSQRENGIKFERALTRNALFLSRETCLDDQREGPPSLETLNGLDEALGAQLETMKDKDILMWAEALVYLSQNPPKIARSSFGINTLVALTSSVLGVLFPEAHASGADDIDGIDNLIGDVGEYQVLNGILVGGWVGMEIGAFGGGCIGSFAGGIGAVPGFLLGGICGGIGGAVGGAVGNVISDGKLASGLLYLHNDVVGGAIVSGLETLWEGWTKAENWIAEFF